MGLTSPLTDQDQAMLPVIIVLALITALVAFDSDSPVSKTPRSKTRSIIDRMMNWIK
jgi:hypothetical protein